MLDIEVQLEIRRLQSQINALIGLSISMYGAIIQLRAIDLAPVDKNPSEKLNAALEDISKKLDVLIEGMNPK